MATANTGGFRLVRCPKCLNVLPEPPDVTVYKCGGCNTTLRAKVRVSNGQNVATKQVRQDSDNNSVATSVSNGVPQNKDPGFSDAAMEYSCTPDAPRTEIEHESNGTRSNENGGVMSTEKNDMEVENAESKEDHNFDGQNTNGRMEGPSDLIHPNGAHMDSDKEENNNVEQSAENSEACRVREDSVMDCSLNASKHIVLLSEGSKLAVKLPQSEQKGACKTEPVGSKRSNLVRVQSQSCDLREGPSASANSVDFHSARTSLQSKSFRASEPLQSKIMKTVDELRGDLSEFFSKPSDCKPRAYPPRPSKQDGHMPRVAITSSLPLTAYHPAAKHSGHAARRIRSGQVALAPRGLPSLRYRRHRAYSCCHSGQMEMRPCPHECCHSCWPPCYRSCKQEPALEKPPVKEIKQRPPPRHHCRPVLGGAPFLVCSNCLSLVQLPTDFAVPSKGTRRLQCGSCSEVLSYSYRDPSRRKLRSPFGDEYSTDDYEIHQVADDHNTGFHQSDPFSYSEEYGLSFGVSYSTKDEQPLHVSRNSSFNTIHERNAKDSKLHRLMGYSSASELLRHSPALYESFHGRTPNARAYGRKGKGICVADDGSGGEDGAVKRSKGRSVGLPLRRILKKGIHGLESLKLRS